MRFQNHSKPGIHPSLLFSPSNNIPIPPIICQRKEILEDSDSGSVFQLFIVGSKQFFRSFDPFLLYLTFSILKIEILLDNLIRQGKEFESKRRRKQELELINTRPGREEAKHLLNARNPLKKNGNTG